MALPKISLEAAANFFNSRNHKEKMLFVVFGVLLAIGLDFLLIVKPLTEAFFQAQPELESRKEMLKALETDKKNEKEITAQWNLLNQKVEASRKRFVSSSELAAENLSKLAQEVGVKILSLTPAEKSKMEIPGAYAQVPIKINAMSGTHALGKFLAKMESNTIFFRVNNLIINEDSVDIKNHPTEIDVECYRKI